MWPSDIQKTRSLRASLPVFITPNTWSPMLHTSDGGLLIQLKTEPAGASGHS